MDMMSDDLEQYTRKHNLEIHGIPEKAEQIIAKEIIKLGNVLKVSICGIDIDICHRLPPRKSFSRPKPIIVRFKSYKAKKKDLCTARKYLKNLDLDEIFAGSNVVHINENLTSMRRELFSKVWKRKKSEAWHSVWTVDGKIFFKKHVT